MTEDYNKAPADLHMVRSNYAALKAAEVGMYVIGLVGFGFLGAVLFDARLQEKTEYGTPWFGSDLLPLVVLYVLAFFVFMRIQGRGYDTVETSRNPFPGI